MIRHLSAPLAFAAILLGGTAANAQSALNLNALQGLAPFSVLGNTDAGRAALAANFKITGDIQNGTAGQPGLQNFAAQQAQALRDAFITGGNAAQLADGLGTKLGGAYQQLAAYSSADDGKTVKYTSVGDNTANLILYSFTLTGGDSNSGKFFFAAAKQKGKGDAVDASPDALAILSKTGGATDVFGKAYHHPAASAGADPFGDSRPFQTEPQLLKYTGPDYFGVADRNDVYLDGPVQDLTASPSFPSGHTTYGYTESTLLAILVPARFTQMITRGAEYGNSRIVLGAHYTMDVIAGRTLAYYDLSRLLSDDAAYENQKEGKASPITDYRAALKNAKAEVIAALAKTCGDKIETCAKDDTSRFSNPAADRAFYESTQTYGLPVVYPAQAGKVEAVPVQAGYLLTAAFPKLSLAKADHILTITEGPGGGFLDDGSAFGIYSRLDLYKAGLLAEKMK